MSVNIGSTAQEILNEINNKIDKTTYEASAELACSSNGKVCLGKFGAYDTNITIELNSTTSTTYHATIVIHSQNVVANGTGGSVGCKVYGDADNHITPLISVFRPYGSASRQIEVYADLPGWSKNLVHIQGVAISTGGMTDVLTSVSSIPTAIDGKIKVTPINVLKSMFASKDVATTSAAGLMSAADKKKLDGVSSGANAYTLPAATADTLGGVKSGGDVSITDGVITVNDNSHNHNYAGSDSAGGAANYTKLIQTYYHNSNNAPQNTYGNQYPAFMQWNAKGNVGVWKVQNYKTAVNLLASQNGDVLSVGSATQPVYFLDGAPVATTYTLGKSVPADAKFTDTTYSSATQSAAGLMSAADKKKLDGTPTFELSGTTLTITTS